MVLERVVFGGKRLCVEFLVLFLYIWCLVGILFFF